MSEKSSKVEYLFLFELVGAKDLNPLFPFLSRQTFLGTFQLLENFLNGNLLLQKSKQVLVRHKTNPRSSIKESNLLILFSSCEFIKKDAS